MSRIMEDSDFVPEPDHVALNCSTGLRSDTSSDVTDVDIETHLPVPKLSSGYKVKESTKSKLRFGIDAILRVTHNTKTENNDVHANDTLLTNRRDVDCEIHFNDDIKTSHTSESDVSDDGEEDSRRCADKLSDMRTGTRMSLIGLASSFSRYSGSDVIRLGNAHGIIPPTMLGTGNFSWSGGTIAEIRKDRFGLVRRIGHPYQNRTPPKRKKPRTSFSRLQIVELEKRFEHQKYLASTERSALARTLKMTDAQVKTWFQNRRTKWRRQTAEEREIERQAANRLLLSLQPDPVQQKSLTADKMCLSHLQRWREQRPADV